MRRIFLKNTRFEFLSLLLFALVFTDDSPLQKASKVPRYRKKSILFTLTTDTCKRTASVKQIKLQKRERKNKTLKLTEKQKQFVESKQNGKDLLNVEIEVKILNNYDN